MQITHDGTGKDQLLTDGSRLYITETNGSLVQVSVAGGETLRIPLPFPDFKIMDISPDHSQFLANLSSVAERAAGVSGEFWAIPLPSGPPHRVADITGGWGKWTNDGRKLIFARASDVYLANADGTEAHKLFTVSEAFPILPFRWMGVASDSRRRPGTEPFRYGKLAWMGRTFMPSCRVGEVCPPNVAVSGRRMGATTFS